MDTCALHGFCAPRRPLEQPLLSVSVKRYIRKGVPLEHRARVWMGVSGAQAQMDQNPGYYHRLLQGERSDRLEEAIRTGEPPGRLGSRLLPRVLTQKRKHMFRSHLLLLRFDFS